MIVGIVARHVVVICESDCRHVFCRHLGTCLDVMQAAIVIGTDLDITLFLLSVFRSSAPFGAQHASWWPDADVVMRSFD